MRTMTRRAKEPCAVCGSKLRPTTVTHEERREAHCYLFQNVPAQVCAACGEVWIEEATLREIDRLLSKGGPVHKVHTQIFNFAVTERK